MGTGKRSKRRGGAIKEREIETQQRRSQALELRKAGATYEAIAAQLGVANGTAHRYVREALENLVSEPAEELRSIHYERLNHMLITLWPRAQRGDIPAVDRVLGIMDRIAVLYGLNTTTHTESREVVIIDGSKDEYITALKRLRTSHAQPINEVGEEVIDLPSDSVEEE